MEFYCTPSRVHWNDFEESHRERHISLKKCRRVVSLPSNIRPLGLYFWTSRGTHLRGHSQGYQRVEKHPRQRTQLPSFTNIRKGHCRCRRASVCWRCPGVRELKRGHLHTSDRQSRLGMTDDIVNMLFHFIGNRMTPHFCISDV